MENTSTIGVQLSTHEAWGLMRLMRLPGIPGLPFPEPDIVPEEALHAAEQLGLDSLRARGLVQFTSDEVLTSAIIDKAAGALLGAGAVCTAWLTLSVDSEPDLTMVTHIYFGPHLSVIHSQPEPGLHLFSAAITGDILFSAIYTGLALENVESPSAPFSVVVHPQDLAEISNDSVTGGAQRLEGLGLHAYDAKHLAMALHGVRRRVSKQTTHTEAVTGFQILTDGIDFYLCVPEAEGVRIEAVSTPQIIDAAMQLIL